MLYESAAINIREEMTSWDDHIDRSDADSHATERLGLSLVSRCPRGSPYGDQSRRLLGMALILEEAGLRGRRTLQKG